MAKSGSVSKARGSSGGGGGSSRTPTIAAVAVLIILAVVVFGGIFWSRSNQQPAAPTALPVLPVSASFTTTLQGNAVVAGSGPTVIDVYEDAQCPACKQFEAAYGGKVLSALNANRVTVKYHLVNLLDRSSTPPGYSTRGGNAMMCAAEHSPNGSAFPTLHNTLYVNQPPEQGSGLTDQQLIDAGHAAGAGPAYDACVQNGTHAAGIADNFAKAQADPNLQQPGAGGGFGTPTIAVGGKYVDPGDQKLLDLLG